MAQKFLVGIDLNKNELLNARIQNLATAPASPVPGQVYYDTATTTGYVWNGTAWVATDAAKVAAGTIPLAKLVTDPLARANHTGTQLAATISNFDAQVRTSTLSQMAAPTAAVAMGGQKFTGLANGAAASDSAAFGQIQAAIDAAVVGLDWKDAVRVASTANIAIATALVNAAVIDGVTLATGDRVLLKDQTAGAENGIYIVAASGAASRSTDAATSAAVKDMSMLVAEGTVANGTQWKLTTDAVVLGITALTFVQHGMGATVITAGNGLVTITNDFNVGQGAGILVTADAVAIDPVVVVRKYAVTIGDATATSIVVTHNLNNQDAVITVRQVADNALILCDVVFTNANAITLTFAVAPALNALRAAVLG